jgi:hypothetical protein
LGLLLAATTVIAALQLVADAMPVSTGSPSASVISDFNPAAPISSTSGIIPLTHENATSGVPGQQPVQCDEMSNHVAGDVLVAMRTEDLRYLDSTLCPTDELPRRSES